MWGWKVHYSLAFGVMLLLQQLTAFPLETPDGKSRTHLNALTWSTDNGQQRDSLDSSLAYKDGSLVRRDASLLSEAASLVPHSRSKRSDGVALFNLIISIIGLASSTACMGVSIANMGCNALQKPVCDLREEFIEQKQELRTILTELNGEYQSYVDLSSLQASVQRSNDDISGRLGDTVRLNNMYRSWIDNVYNHQQRNAEYADFVKSLMPVSSIAETSTYDIVTATLSSLSLVTNLGAIAYSAYDLHIVDDISQKGGTEWTKTEGILSDLNLRFTFVNIVLCASAISHTVQMRNARIKSLEGNISQVIEYTATLRKQKSEIHLLNIELQGVLDDDTTRFKSLLEGATNLSVDANGFSQDELNSTIFTSLNMLKNIDPTTINKENIEQYQQSLRAFTIDEHKALNKMFTEQKKMYLIKDAVLSSKAVRDIQTTLESVPLPVNDTFEIYAIVAHKFPEKTSYDEVRNLDCIRQGTIQSQADLQLYLSIQTATITTEQQRQYINILATVHTPLNLIVQATNNEFNQPFTTNHILYEIANLDQFRDMTEYVDNPLTQYRTDSCQIMPDE